MGMCGSWNLALAAGFVLILATNAPAEAAKRKVCDDVRPELDARSGRFHEAGRYYEIPFVLRCRNGARVNGAEVDGRKLNRQLAQQAREFCRRTGGGLNTFQPGSRTKFVFLDSARRVVSSFWLNNSTCRSS